MYLLRSADARATASRSSKAHDVPRGQQAKQLVVGDAERRISNRFSPDGMRPAPPFRWARSRSRPGREVPGPIPTITARSGPEGVGRPDRRSLTLPDAGERGHPRSDWSARPCVRSTSGGETLPRWRPKTGRRCRLAAPPPGRRADGPSALECDSRHCAPGRNFRLSRQDFPWGLAREVSAHQATPPRHATSAAAFLVSRPGIILPS